MFLNNPSSTRSILSNNENSMLSRRPKMIGENGTKRASFNENAVKTPHRNKDASKGGQTTQRRRRALGDISNRKAGGGAAGGGKGGVVLKQANNTTSHGSLKNGNGKSLFPSSSTKNRTTQVKFSKTPSYKSTNSNKARLGGGSAMKSANSKPKQCAKSEEYDGVFGVTTRWARDDADGDDARSIFERTGTSKEDLFLGDVVLDEMAERADREDEERDRLFLEKAEEGFQEAIREVQDMEKVLGPTPPLEEPVDEWDILDEKMPWEEEDGEFDPAEERRRSGTDPYSLWGDILG